MRTITHINKKPEWKKTERIIFRVLFIFFMLQALPLDWKYFYHIAHIQWSNFTYRDLFYLARYTPQFSTLFPTLNSWGFGTLVDLSIVLALAALGGIAWSIVDKRTKSYPDLYYLLRVVLRYRLAVAVIAYGFIKWFPIQQPYPSLSLLNTNYGDLSDWKIASLSYGVAASLESFLGAVEIFAGILLLFQKSASMGAAIVIGFTGNVLLSHWGYGGGEWLYCCYLLSMASVILWFDARRWYSLLVLEKPTNPNSYKPTFLKGWKHEFRYTVKAVVLAFVIPLFGVFAHELYKQGGYQYPATIGLTNAAGLYNVSQFRMNGEEIPYSLTDTLRWHNVVFESWNTLSIGSNQVIVPDRKNTEELYLLDNQRDFESTESNGRRFYSYTIDSTTGVLQLQHKNKNYKSDALALRYNRPSPGRIVLSGKDESGDEIEVVLDKLQKEYLMNESVTIPRLRSVFNKGKE